MGKIRNGTMLYRLKIIDGGNNMGQHAVLAVDIGGSKFVIGLITRQGDILYKRKYKWGQISEKNVVNCLFQAMSEAIRINTDIIVDSVGMTIPGLADSEKGMWISAHFMGIYNLPMRAIMQEKLGIPVFLDNDCNACAQAEMLFGSCKNISDFLYITVSNSIGGALVLDGKVYNGAHGKAGEIGLFSCIARNGRRRPLEQIASGRGIAEEYIALGGLKDIAGSAPNGENISQLARKGDKVAVKVFKNEGKYLGYAIADACELLDPEKVIIGGGISLVFDLYKNTLFHTIEECSDLMKYITVEPTILGYDGALYGAACLAIAGY